MQILETRPKEILLFPKTAHVVNEKRHFLQLKKLQSTRKYLSVLTVTGVTANFQNLPL